MTLHFLIVHHFKCLKFWKRRHSFEVWFIFSMRKIPVALRLDRFWEGTRSLTANRLFWRKKVISYLEVLSAHFETVVYHYSFTLPTGNNKLLAAPLHQQRWRYKVWNHILRCCQSHVYTTVASLRFVHFSIEIGPLRNWIQRQNAAEIAAALVQFMEMCTKLCLATVHTQKTWAGGEPIKN